MSTLIGVNNIGLFGSNSPAKKGKKLPYDAEIEYLESTGTQYIDTGFVPRIGDSFHMEVNFTANQSNYYTLLSAGIGTYQLVFVVTASNQFCRFFSNVAPYVRLNLSSNKWYTLDISGEGDTSFAGMTWKASPVEELDGDDTNLWLYKRHNLNTPLIGKMKNFYVKRNGAIVLHYTPVRVGDVGYFYDKVSGELFGNSGTYNFVLGPDVGE